MENVDAVWATFNQPITPLGLTVVNAAGKSVADATLPIAVETSIEEQMVIGATFTPSAGVLVSGRYSATLTAQEVTTGETVIITWSFDAIAQNRQLFLPIVAR